MNTQDKKEEIDRLNEMMEMAIKWLKACYQVGNTEQAKTWLKVIGIIRDRLVTITE